MKVGDGDPRPYAYVCEDRSLLVRPFCRYVVRWFVIWVPLAVPANLLTLGSSACMWLMLALAAFSGSAQATAFPCLVLMAGYVLYDHADGMHARRTGRSGPLGEFLDHYLDAFHGPIAVAVMFLVAGQERSALLPLTACSVLLAGAATMVEQRETGVLHFGRLGPLEGMLLTLAVLGSWSLPHQEVFWLMPRGALPTAFQATALVCMAAGAATALGCAVRLRRIAGYYAVFALASATLASAVLWRMPAWPWWAVPVVLALHGADFTGRVIVSRLVGSERPLPDLASPAVLVLARVTGLDSPWVFGAAAAYLLARCAAVPIAAFRAFGADWRWRN